jgi:hypothetical protein
MGKKKSSTPDLGVCFLALLHFSEFVFSGFPTFVGLSSTEETL